MPHSKRKHYHKVGGATPLLVNWEDVNHMRSLRDFDRLDTGACPTTPSVLKPVERIIAIGDIHGDAKALMFALREAGVIDTNGGWIGGKTVVVQVGDILDRGGRGISVPSQNGLEEIEILYFLYKLNKSARTKGGRVISLIGNHELMNMIGDFRYVSPEHLSGLGGRDERIQLFQPGGRLAKKIACNSLGIVKIGDWVFVHGGLLPQHIQNMTNLNIKKGVTALDNINDLIRNILLGEKRLDSISDQEEALLFGGEGIFWTRKYSDNRVSDKNCGLLLDTMALLEMDKTRGGLVVGHTPQFNINSRCNDKVWRIDTGMSEAFGHRSNELDRIEVLEIIKNGEEIRVL